MLQYSDSDFFEFQKIRFDEEDRASYQMHKPQINKELSRSLSSARSSAKGSHTCTKDIAEQFDLKQAIKIPNLLSSQYAM